MLLMICDILFQVDLLTDIAHSPRILTNIAAAIQPATFKKVVILCIFTSEPCYKIIMIWLILGLRFLPQD